MYAIRSYYEIVLPVGDGILQLVEFVLVALQLGIGQLLEQRQLIGVVSYNFV